MCKSPEELEDERKDDEFFDMLRKAQMIRYEQDMEDELCI
jgi:hypothetical protein